MNRRVAGPAGPRKTLRGSALRLAARATADGTTFALKGEQKMLHLDDLRLKTTADGGWWRKMAGRRNMV